MGAFAFSNGDGLPRHWRAAEGFGSIYSPRHVYRKRWACSPDDLVLLSEASRWKGYQRLAKKPSRFVRPTTIPACHAGTVTSLQDSPQAERVNDASICETLPEQFMDTGRATATRRTRRKNANTQRRTTRKIGTFATSDQPEDVIWLNLQRA